jgi:hypothetical protein
MAKLGLLKNGCTQGTQEIKISTWHKVDVDGKVCASGGKTSLDSKIQQLVVAILWLLPCFMLKNLSTEPQAHNMSTDIVHVCLSACILQQYILCVCVGGGEGVREVDMYTLCTHICENLV